MLRRKILSRNVRAEKSLPSIIEGESSQDKQNLSRSDNAKDMKRFSLSSIFMNGSTTNSTFENYLHTINEDSEDKNPSLENSNDDDSISTVSHSLEFNNDSSNLSLASQSELPSVNDLRSFSRPFSIVFHDEDDDELSYSSVNTEAFKQIRDLKNKLRVQENTKIHLIEQLQKKMSSSEKAMLVNYIKSLKKENHKLLEGVAKMEHKYMNDLCKLETVIEKKDDKIAKLEKKMAQLEAKLKEGDSSTKS